MPSKMSDGERDEFMSAAHLGYLGIGRTGKGPLLAPIWYSFEPGVGIYINIGAISAKAKRLRAEGRASMLVVEAASGRYRSCLVEGPVTLRHLGDETEEAILAMSSRYLGPRGGRRYTEDFMRKLATNDFPDGHGDSELQVTISPETWRTEILP
jgi:nitroimidazol reductase NimA-like FMN-containing flavoprotein (pyridoxamine 5'-phosphate oxidase superfamily)